MTQTHFYDDAEFSYLDYWRARQYEDAAEKLAIKRMLGKRTFSTAADIGGGYGRLTSVIASYVKQTTLVEPSEKMRKTAQDFLKSQPSIKIQAGTADKTGLTANSCDLVTMFRVLHHIPNLQGTFSEMRKIVKPQGYLLIEFANSSHFKSRLKSFLTGEQIMLTPMERRSAYHIRQKTIDFVNHHPDTLFRELAKAHFSVQKIYSVSNFRSQIFKKLIPLPILLVLEYLAQSLLSSLYFGPSIFVLARKIDK